jgi:cell volume regulation protein A
MEAAGSVEVAKHVLLLIGLILAIGTATGIVASKLKVPDVALFLLVGLCLGPDALGLITVKADSAMNQLILIFGSCYILFDGGASLRLKVLKEVWVTIVVIATVGVIVTGAITGFAAQYLLGVPLIIALLLGATLASTDPATLVPIFKQVKIKDRVAQTVMSESAFNDAMGAIATFAVLGVAMGAGEFSVGHALGELAWQAGLGLLAGGILGYLAALLIAHEKWNFLSEYAPWSASWP